MSVTELLKIIFLGIVEGITEWLPISSTGHMILVDEMIQLNLSSAFKEMFYVVIQLGAIMAVVILYWKRLCPVEFGDKPKIKTETISLWVKIIIASVPLGVVGILWEDDFNRLFYNPTSVAIALIVFGILFIVIEKIKKNSSAKINSIEELTFRAVVIIGLFQMIAGIFPGTSRSGATIVGALLIGVSRKTASEFTFFLAVPAMCGASLLKLLKFGFSYTGAEIIALTIGCLTAFFVSLAVIKLFMGYIKKHDFIPFGWYRILLGTVVFLYFR